MSKKQSNAVTGQRTLDSQPANARRRTNKPQKARRPMMPDGVLPSAAPIKAMGHGSSAAHRGNARRPSKARQTSIVVSTSGSMSAGPSSTESPAVGHKNADLQNLNAGGRDSASIVHKLRALHRQRRAVIKRQIQDRLPVLSLLRWLLGWTPDKPEAERKRIKALAVECLDAMLAGESVPDEAADACANAAGYVNSMRQSAEPVEKFRKDLEIQMAKLAEQLPVWGWVEGIKGFGAIGLASIVGEVGDLSNFANPAKLWKYLGLAPKPCYIKEADKGPEIPRERRSISWMYADSLLRQANEYQALYKKRRAYECQQHPEFLTGKLNEKGEPQVTKHCDNRARRYAEKRFILHLWRAWKAASMSKAA